MEPNREIDALLDGLRPIAAVKPMNAVDYEIYKLKIAAAARTDAQYEEGIKRLCGMMGI